MGFLKMITVFTNGDLATCCFLFANRDLQSDLIQRALLCFKIIFNLKLMAMAVYNDPDATLPKDLINRFADLTDSLPLTVTTSWRSLRRTKFVPSTQYQSLVTNVPHFNLQLIEDTAVCDLQKSSTIEWPQISLDKLSTTDFWPPKMRLFVQVCFILMQLYSCWYSISHFAVIFIESIIVPLQYDGVLFTFLFVHFDFYHFQSKGLSFVQQCTSLYNVRTLCTTAQKARKS